MDERLKRRLVGGLLLIGVAWVLAALLPPPAPPGARQGETVVFDLRQPDAPPLTPTPTSPPETEPVAPVEDDSEAGEWPQPAASEDAPAVTPAPTARPSVRPTPAPTPSPTRAPVTPTPAAAPAGSWWVQVGAYSAREGAEQVRETLRVADLPARVESATVNGRTIHRVRIGPYSGQGQAESAQARSVLLGYANAAVIAP